MRYLLFIIISLGGFGHLIAQTALQRSFNWSEGAISFSWDETDFVKYEFEGAVLNPQGNTILPYWVETFPVRGAGELRVSIVDVEYENFVADPRANLSTLPQTLSFETSVTRQPEGWIGKVSLLPMLRNISGYQRIKQIQLRIEQLPSTTASPRSGFVERSVLADGDIYQISISQTGVYKLSRDFLRNDLGIDNLDNIDPRSIRLYGQPGGMLPEVVADEAPDDLIEQAILIEGEGDGSFDGDDFLVFYGEGPSVWEFDANSQLYNQTPNIYSNTNYYYLKIGEAGNGMRVNTVSESGGTTVNSYDALSRFEKEAENPLHLIGTASGSGQLWFGDFFKVSRERTYENLFTIPDLVPNEPARLRARMALRTGPTSASSRYFIEIEGQEVNSSLGGGVNFNSVLQRRAVRLTTLDADVQLTNPNVSLKVSYPFPATAFASEAWLDFIQIRARRSLRMSGDQFNFRDSRTLEQNAVTWQIANANANTRVWRVNNGVIQALNGQLSGSNLTVNAQINQSLQEFVAFNLNAGLMQAEAIGKIENQDLHTLQEADMLVVSHPDFLQHAQTLAEHRRTFSGLTVEVVTTNQVYHEFSSGKDDPAAIRNFARMIYERDPELKYLLLVGDGSFDHRNIYGLGTNFIPAFEHQGIFTEVNDFPSDDFYGIFGTSTNRQPLDPDLNISIGRLPVRSADQARGVVDKIIRYDTDPNTLGDWRTRMVFVGDDEDGGLHLNQVDGISTSIGQRKPEMNFDKLYFDLFPQLSLSAGDRYPDITEGLDRAVFRGALAVTYLGHGGPRGWAQERVLSIPQIRNWTNPNNLPIFITATCTFAGYDDAEFVSAGEETFLSERGGAIALLTTTRPVFATENRRLTDATLQAMIDRPDGQWRTLGDVIRIAKNTITTRGTSTGLNGSTENARKFTLLGDPASVIALPTNNIRTTMVNGEDISEARTDTVRALQQITISGEVVDVNGVLLTDFNGLVYPTVFDKPQTIATLQQDVGSPEIDVEVQRSIVFRGRATVTNGRFSFTFVVPSDINYDFGQGKISYYAADPSTRRDAAGFYDQLVIGGTNPESVADDNGPEVQVFMNSEDFVFGGEVERDATLLVKLQDDLGINVTGNSIGHDLEAVIDEDTRNAIVLNDYYEANPDDFRSGEVRFPLFDLEPGQHTISVRAWDVANNNSTGNTEFVVAADSRDALSRVLNYPNPFTDFTCFQFDHTLSGQDVNVIIQIFTVSGRLVKSIEAFLPFSDGAIRLDDCIEWDGKDDYGDQLARGVYLYQVRLQGSERTVEGDFEKLVILK